MCLYERKEYEEQERKMRAVAQKRSGGGLPATGTPRNVRLVVVPALVTPVLVVVALAPAWRALLLAMIALLLSV